MKKVGSGTVSRVVSIVRILAQSRQDVSVSELANELALPPSTVHRLLHLLVTEGVVERSHIRGQYGLGVEFMCIGALAASKNRLLEIASPLMRSVAAKSGEACTLHMFLPASLEVAPIGVERSGIGLGYKISLYKPKTLMWGASGKSVLPYLSERTIQTGYSNDPGCPVNGKPLPPFRDYMDQLVRAQRRGYAVTLSEKARGIAAIGAPLFKPTGEPVGTLNIVLSEERYSANNEKYLSEILIEHAIKLNNMIGFAQGPVPSRMQRKLSSR